jgi:hypothetical protein
VGQFAPAPSDRTSELGLADFFSAAGLKLAGLGSGGAVVAVVLAVLEALLEPPELPQAVKANATMTMKVMPIPILILNSNPPVCPNF